jgi:hypothetical protein
VNIELLNNAELKEILNNSKSGIYTFRDYDKKIILTFFNEGEKLTISPFLLNKLQENDINKISQDFILNISKDTDYVGTRLIYLDNLDYIQGVEKIKEQKLKNYWMKLFKKKYKKDIFKNINTIAKELEDYVVINLSKKHMQYHKEITSNPIDIDFMIQMGNLYHELGHFVKKESENKNSHIEYLNREMFADSFSLVEVYKRINNDKNKKTIFDKYSNWEIELRSQIKIKGVYLNYHYTVPALISVKKYINENLKDISTNNYNYLEKELTKISRDWSYDFKKYRKYILKNSDNKNILNEVDLTENINKKMLLYQIMFKESFGQHL